MKKVFLTGAQGFVGRNMLELLSHEYEFVAPTRDELDLTHTEQVYNFLKKEKPDIVVHAASVGGSRREKQNPTHLHTNLKMFFNLLRGKDFFDRMIVCGSGAEYDKSRSLHLVTEESFGESIPRDDYGFGKYIMSSYAQRVGYITHMRLFGVYGKYEDYGVRFISNAVAKAVLGMPITIRQNVMFDYLYVNDFVRIIQHMIDTKPIHTFYNIGSGHPIDLLSIAREIVRIAQKDISIIVAREGFNHEYTCDTSRLTEEFSDIICTPLADSISALFDYYTHIKDTLDTTLLLTDE